MENIRNWLEERNAKQAIKEWSNNKADTVKLFHFLYSNYKGRLSLDKSLVDVAIEALRRTNEQYIELHEAYMKLSEEHQKLEVSKHMETEEWV